MKFMTLIIRKFTQKIIILAKENFNKKHLLKNLNLKFLRDK
jgi:hypothetical protein